MYKNKFNQLYNSHLQSCTSELTKLQGIGEKSGGKVTNTHCYLESFQATYQELMNRVEEEEHKHTHYNNKKKTRFLDNKLL